MTTLNAGSGHLALINTFVVEPENAERLLQLLIQATAETMQGLPGFVSANLHVSLDRKHVANYAQWRSKQDFEAMLQNPAAQGHMREAAKLAKSFEPVTYELRHVID
jgi:quinol monooxygenase YgiN